MIANNTCVLWTQARDKAGYGVSWKDGKVIRAHRKVYLETYGPIPTGLMVRHTCDNRSCVNPKHLLLGTAKQNSQDMVERNRQAKGTKVGTSILNEDTVRIIRSLSGTSQQLADFVGCSTTTIKDIRNNKHWKHV